MNEHVFSLKTGIDDFKHLSSRFYTVFLDFRDAFGTLSHSVMIQSLVEINLPSVFIDIIRDIYTDSFIQVICGDQLTKPIHLGVGIKTGCPWSAVNFIIAINSWLKWLEQCAPLDIKSPNPIQGFADDVLIASREERVITQMLLRTDAFLQWSGLEAKNTKCAVFYERRSGGNRWYKSKCDKLPSFSIMGKEMKVYARHDIYCYLGHKFNVAGEWEEQLRDIEVQYSSRLEMIDKSPLPTIMKLAAVREIALSKVQHFFANIHIPKYVLTEMNNKSVHFARKWLGLNTHTTRDFFFHKRREGGFGLPNVDCIYTATRINHLLRMLNSDDPAVREQARGSLLLDLTKRKIPRTTSEANFLGFRKKPSGKLDTRAPGFGVRSDWPDLNNLCNRAQIHLSWSNASAVDRVVEVSDAVVTDSSISVRAVLNLDESTTKVLNPQNCRQDIIEKYQLRQRQHWAGLRLQGKLACLPCADHTVSHSILRNTAIDESILKFAIKARLQVLPTKFNLALWYPSQHESHCILHNNREPESVAHIMNGCPALKGLYTARHDRIVDLIASKLRSALGQYTQFHINKRVQMDWFISSHTLNSFNSMVGSFPNTPDIVMIDECNKTVLLLEIGCSFDAYMDSCFSDKWTKYQALANAISACGYNCKTLVLVFGSLGHVHKLCVRGLQLAGLVKKAAKQLVKFCSISAIIGSHIIWKRRCHLYP